MIDKDDLRENLQKIKAKSSKVNQNILAIVLALVFATAFIFTLMGIGKNTAQYEELHTENEIAINELKQKIGKLDEQKQVEENVIKQALNSASEAGSDVANYQNKYRSLDAKTNESGFMANVNKLDGFFDEASKNARTPWYALSDRGIEYEWEFMSTYSFAADTIDVIWLAKNHSGDIYAYAIGKYDVLTGLFKNVKWKMTYMGAKYVSPTTTSFEPINPDKIMNEVENLNDIEVEGREQSDEELQNLREAQEKMRQLQRQQQNKN